MTLRLHHFLPFSRANGPGNRAVIWLQGCTLGCPGCFNPATHSPTAGFMKDVDELVNEIRSSDRTIEGITISGGEPLQQRRPLTEFLRRIRSETSLSVLLFSGFTWAEIVRFSEENHQPIFLSYVDVLIAGRYEEAHRVASGLRGSRNKTIHLLTRRYTLDDVEAVPPAELIVGPQGDLLVSGIDPVQFEGGPRAWPGGAQGN